ncbi:MAG TPA: VgrG-related protein [Chloroflexota bacterium]|nr:VgrG-related protein [Chloroflexota bacterium]
MPEQKPLSSEIKISVGGSPVQPTILAQVAELTVDQHAHLPHMFTIRLLDPNLELLSGGPFDLTKEVKIEVGDAREQLKTLMTGEITALEPTFGEGMVAELWVRGYDKSHRLYRQRKSQAFLNKKDSDLATQMAQAVGLQTQVEVTNTVYDHIYQHNQSDLEFLMQRAWRIGYECFVEEGKLYFRKPPSGSASVTLKWGEDLLTFYPRMTLAEQVGEVIVKGWDPKELKAIVGQAQSGKLYPEIGESKNGAAWASAFGTGKMVVVDQPVLNQSEANTLAEARLNELSGAFVQAEGVAFRRPDIKAGQWIKLENLGTRFSGKYLVTRVTHVYSPEGLRCQFVVYGTRTGTLLEATNGSRPSTRWPGVVIGVVTNTEDPNKWGRVKVKFPWMADDAESDWARLVGPGGGPKAGFYAVPDVGDEVVVAFEHGDFSRPYIIGGLWNGKHDIPPTAASAGNGERPLVRTWHSRTGHAITMHDDSDNKVEIKTAGGHTITLDDAGSKLEIKSKNGITINIDDGGNKLTIEGSNEVLVKSSTNMTLEAGANMDLKATGNMKLQANGTIDVQATGPASVKGAVVNLN